MTWEEWFNLSYEQLVAKFEQWEAEKLHPVERAVKALSFSDELLEFQIRAILRLEVLGRMQLAYLAVIAGTPPDVPPVALVGRPISKFDLKTITQTTYQTVVEWKIPALHRGELFEVEMATSGYAHTRFRLLLADEEQWTDKELPTAFAQSFRANKLTENMTVSIQAKSTDGTEITAYAAIAGQLIAP